MKGLLSTTLLVTENFHLLPLTSPLIRPQKRRVSYEDVPQSHVQSHPVVYPLHSQSVAKWFHFLGCRRGDSQSSWLRSPMCPTSCVSHEEWGFLKNICWVLCEEDGSHQELTRAPGQLDPSVSGNERRHLGHATIWLLGHPARWHRQEEATSGSCEQLWPCTDVGSPWNKWNGGTSSPAVSNVGWNQSTWKNNT